jgi:ferrochelatase
MQDFTIRTDFQHDQPRRLGVLLTNLGTPDAPTAAAVRRYLGEFLWDPRVVEIPRPLWWLILHGIVLRTRPARVARAYASVWTDEGAPLLKHSRAMANALQASLAEEMGDSVRVALGMRYGQPSLASALDQLREQGVNRLLVLPLYPQYSSTTTASTLDALADILKQWRWVPELRMVMQYHDHPLYIEAIAASVQQHWQANGRSERLMFSFHGLPKRNLELGDPYFCECHKTARLVAEKLSLATEDYLVCFQSRFGKAEWLQPYTDATIKSLPGQGVKTLDVLSPGFPADCLETVEEVAEQYRDLFLHAGGERYHYIPALNAAPSNIKLLSTLAQQHTRGWQELSSTDPAACLQLAKQHGADK